MATRIGLIPAAGRANRFAGTMKELLPVSKHYSLMDYSIMAMERGRCDPIVCVTSARKIAALSEHRPRLLYTLQVEARDIFGAILAGLAVEADEYCFAMPDTVIPDDAFDRDMIGDISFGTFYTETPERFGMLRDGQIVNKMKGEPGRAWGVIMWSRRVRDYWLQYSVDFLSYTDAFNHAMRVFAWKTFDLSEYNDVSNFDEYKRLLGERAPV